MLSAIIAFLLLGVSAMIANSLASPVGANPLWRQRRRVLI
ncbi:hypothetical protein yrohd0001_31520 [Yersinia rohdei ATCC 43380]|nr:hypothetical protein yrohd0001_31520 [Yersinia rohdei ATCC 43380]